MTREQESNTSYRKDSPRLTFFIPTLDGGGAENVIINIMNGLSARGYDIELLLSRFDPGWQSELASDVTVTNLPPASRSVFGIAAHMPALIRYLRKEAPAALFPHLTHVNILSVATDRLIDSDTMIFPTHHLAFGTYRTARGRLANWTSRRLYPSADRIIAVSDCVADTIAARTAVDRRDISVLYNPVEIESIQRRAHQGVEHEWLEDDGLQVVLFVGRLEQQKDLKTWLRTFKTVHNQAPETRGIIAGRGRLREELIDFTDNLGLNDVISLPGYVDNPYGYMRQADCFLLSSRMEGLPTVLIEAIACGCPIVATDCQCGPREILVDGKYGRLAPVGDVDELASGVLETLADPPSTDALQARAGAFDTEATLDEYEQFIEEYVITA